MQKLLSFSCKLFLANCAFFCFSNSVYSCTTAFYNTKGQNQVVARTMDLYFSDMPLLKVFPRGITMNTGNDKNDLHWTTKYGSVVVTAFRTDVVSDGINEKGFSVHLLYLSGTEYPKANPSKAQIPNLLWGRYLLDNFATVAEALKATNKLEIYSSTVQGREWPIHVTIEDPTGDSAIIEIIKGKTIIYHSPKYRVMTNEPAYNIQLANVKKYKLFGGKLSMPGDVDPLSRFVRVSSYLKTSPTPKNEIESIANILSVIRTAMVPFGAEDSSGNKAEDAWPTRWVTVADLTNKIYYFNSTTTPNIIWIDLNKLDFNVGSPVLTIDPADIHLEGDITTKFAPT